MSPSAWKRERQYDLNMHVFMYAYMTIGRLIRVHKYKRKDCLDVS